MELIDEAKRLFWVFPEDFQQLCKDYAASSSLVKFDSSSRRNWRILRQEIENYPDKYLTLFHRLFVVYQEVFEKLRHENQS